MGFFDRARAMGAGAAQGATLGWGDEAVAKLLSRMPTGDDTGIPREYASGSAYNDIRDSERADNAAAQSKYPASYGTGQVMGGAPLAAATMATGGLPAVALGATEGAIHGAGASENTGRELAKDTARGLAVGGGSAAAGNAAAEVAPAISSLYRRGPPMPSAAPVAAMAEHAPVPAPVPNIVRNENGLDAAMAAQGRPRPLMNPAPAPAPAPYMNPRDKYYDKFTRGFGALKNAGKITPEQYEKLAQTSKDLAALPMGEPPPNLSPSLSQAEKELTRAMGPKPAPVMGEADLAEMRSRFQPGEHQLEEVGKIPDPVHLEKHKFLNDEGETFDSPYSKASAKKKLGKELKDTAPTESSVKKTAPPRRAKKK